MPDPRERFLEAWNAVRIERPVHYGLFTFGESLLPYFLVCAAEKPGGPVTIVRGEVRIARPMIITPHNVRPEFRNFFEDDSGDQVVDFLLARSAAFSHLRFENRHGPERIVSDHVEEAVAKLGRQLDDEEEDRTAILSAPAGLGPLAVMRYAVERVQASTADNIQELRERGFLD